MGYCMYLRDYSLRIKKEDFSAALEAVKKSFPSYDALQRMSDFIDVMVDYGYDPELDQEGNIDGLMFIGQKLRDDFEFWSAVAPYVEDGCFIEMEGEDFTLWRWVFKDGKCKEMYPTITWEEE